LNRLDEDEINCSSSRDAELPVWENESENYTRNGDLKMT